MEFENHTVAAAGCDLHYLEAGNGPTVVFLHGGGGFRFDAETFGALAQRYRLLVPSMPGFDASTPGTTTNIEDVADVVAQFIRQVGGGRAHVIGESFGGGVASWLAIRHPDLVSTLILAAPSGLRDGHGLSPSQLSPAEVYSMLYGGKPQPSRGAERGEVLKRNRANSDRIHRTRPDFDQALYERLNEVQAPTLVMWGTDDRLIPPTHARYYRERVPTVRVNLLKGGPHVLSASVPDQFLPPVLAMLDDGKRYVATSEAERSTATPASPPGPG